MKDIVVGRWGSAFRDLRGGRAGGIEGEARFPSPDVFPDSAVALMSGKGFFLFDETMSFVPLAREYVRRIQAEYCCGKCLSGIKGTQVLLVTLNRIMNGQGTSEDLDVLGRVAAVLDRSAKCSVCQTAGELIKDGLNHFRDDFVKAIDWGVPDRPLRYVFKISAPCMTTCPCHINIPSYVEMLQEVRYGESLAIIREEMPMPGVTGRVCPAPCQKACTLANFGTATIPIKILKRMAADYEMLHKLDPPLEKRDLTEPPVAVIGAGPAGLGAAYYLNRLGHQVTIFEALPLSGGMVGVGIPPYRQPKDVLMRDVDVILSLGVKLEQGVRLGWDFTIQDLFQRGFKAVFLGIGSHSSVSLGIKGEEDRISGVFKGGIDLLREINLGEPVEIGNRVIIVGGGNTAIDCARTCVRMGASEVHVVYRRTEKEMPADHLEVEDAAEEGIVFHFLTQPIEIIASDGVMTGLRCIRMELGEPDKSGRRRPVPVEGSEFEMEADTLIPAIGQTTQLDFVTPQDGVEVTRWGTIKVDPRSMMTTRSGVFAGGDAVSGPLTVVHGIAGGKRAAKAIHEYLERGFCTVSDDQLMEGILADIEKDTTIRVTPRSEGRKGPIMPPKKLDMRERLTTFEEVESGLTQAGSFVESSRCLRCFHLVMVGLAD